MPDGRDEVDRLRAAIEAHERFVAERGRRSASEFLTEHEELRDLLEPLFDRERPLKPGAEGAQVLGDFRLLGELGRGGMGVVYDAEQISLGRRVAVKVLPGRLGLDPDRRARFERESRLAASLDHPGVAKVITADADGDTIWFAMERIDGAPLDRVLSRTADTQVTRMTGGLLESVVDQVTLEHVGGATAPEAAHDVAAPGTPESTVWRRGYVDTVVRIGAQIAEALHHAHQHGVIHRDVKPGNVLLRRDGSAVLTDFGLARELGGPSLSLTGDFLGTPSYSAPEQLSGERSAVDHRADVFGLGATLYELLTHRRPFEASTADEVRARILTVEPRRPRRLNPRIPSDLSSVLLKALEKDPEQRYQSAAAMAEDLRAVAADRPVKAVAVRAHRRAWRWCRRNRWATTALASLSGVVLLLLMVRAQLVEANAEQSKSAVRDGLALARAQDFRGALAGLMPLEERLPGPATAAALDELFRRYPCLASYALTSEAQDRVRGARFSADGKLLLTVHERTQEAEDVRWQVRLWPVPGPGVPTSRLQYLWESDPGPSFAKTPVHVSPGRTVAWFREDRTVLVGGPGRATSEIGFTEDVLALLTVSAPGRFGVVLAEQVRLVDTQGRVVREWPFARDSELSVAAIFDGALIRAARTPGSRMQWTLSSVPDGAPIDIGAGYPRISDDPEDPGRMVVVTDAWVSAWRRVDGGLELEARQANWLPRGVSATALLEDGLEPIDPRYRFARRDVGALRLWRSRMLAAQFIPGAADRSREPYIVAVEDRALRIWGAPDPFVLDPQEGGLENAAFEPATGRLWCAGVETLTAWSFDAGGVGESERVEMPRGIREARDAGLTPSFCGIAFDPGRSILACARGDVERWRSPGWVVVVPADELQGARSYPCRSEPGWIAFSPDRRQVAVCERDGGVEVWAYDPRTLELSNRAALPARVVNAGRLSCVLYLGPRFLVASQADRLNGGGILRWDLEAPDAPPVSVAPPGSSVLQRCLAASPDGRLVATGGDDCAVRVLRVVQRGGAPELVPLWSDRHGAEVFAVAFAEREGALVLASADRRGGIRLWDAETGADGGLVREVSQSEEEMILSLGFSPDGRYLAASQHGGRALLWDMDRPRRCLEGNRGCAGDLLRQQAASE